MTEIFAFRKRSASELFMLGVKSLHILSMSLVLLLLNSCIEEFNPELGDSIELVVIDGSVIKGNSIQQVVVSRSTPIDNNKFNPITDCKVWLVDDANRTFHFEEKSDGIYQAAIPEEYLAFNSRFKLRVTTPNKNEYESDYETILESSPIDSVYYGEESYQSSSEQYEIGLQFYIDLKSPEENTKNYRWKLIETWQYSSKYLIDGFWDSKLDTFIIYTPAIDSLYYCWSTSSVNELYTSSTENLVVNQKKKIPLNYIPGISYKLTEKYCLLVQQYTLSDAAYVYWDKNRVHATESGGLYQTQPSQSKSNIHNLNDPNEIVLGFFWASSFSEKRSFFDGPLFGYNYKYRCDTDTLTDSDILELTDDAYIFIFMDFGDSIVWATTSPECLNCTKQGGTNIKPNFWED